MLLGLLLGLLLDLGFATGLAMAILGRVAALTAPSDGVWEPRGDVTHEEVRHMKNRVQQFEAHHELPKQQLVGVPSCASS